MLPFVYYLLKAVVCSALFAAYYLCFLRNGRFYNFNRAYLVGAVVLSLLIPLLSITVTVKAAPAMFQPIGGEAAGALTPFAAQAIQQQAHLITTGQLATGIYLLLVIVFIGLQLAAVLGIMRLKKQSVLTRIQNLKLYLTNADEAPFTFFRLIFWRNDIEPASPDGQRILRHELAHICFGHAYDKAFMQLICALFWINPVFWFLKRELNLVHEFAADKATVTGNDSAQLATLLLSSLYPLRYREFTHAFFKSPIKRRLIMLSKKHPQRLRLLRQCMIIPLVAVALGAFALKLEAKYTLTAAITATELQQPGNAVLYKDAVVKPVFKNKLPKDFSQWVGEQLRKNEQWIAATKDIAGTIAFGFGFTVNEQGTLEDVTVTDAPDKKMSTDVSQKLKDILKSVVLQSPKWTPGKDAQGNPVKVRCNDPLFYLGFKWDASKEGDNSSMAVMAIKPVKKEGDIKYRVEKVESSTNTEKQEFIIIEDVQEGEQKKTPPGDVKYREVQTVSPVIVVKESAQQKQPSANATTREEVKTIEISPVVAVKEGAQEKKPFVTVKPVEGQTEPYSIDVTVQETEKQGVVTVRSGDVQLTAETVEVNTLDGTTYYVTSAAPQEKVKYVATDSTSAKQHFYIELKKK